MPNSTHFCRPRSLSFQSRPLRPSTEPRPGHGSETPPKDKIWWSKAKAKAKAQATTQGRGFCNGPTTWSSTLFTTITTGTTPFSIPYGYNTHTTKQSPFQAPSPTYSNGSGRCDISSYFGQQYSNCRACLVMCSALSPHHACVLVAPIDMSCAPKAPRRRSCGAYASRRRRHMHAILAPHHSPSALMGPGLLCLRTPCKCSRDPHSSMVRPHGAIWVPLGTSYQHGTF